MFSHTIIERFDGAWAGIDALRRDREERGPHRGLVEPFLLQQVFRMRTSRGRIVTRAPDLHFVLKTPERIVQSAAFRGR